MNVIKQILTTFVAISMLAVSAHAEDTYDASYKIEMKDGIVSVTEDELYSETDNSNLLVKVIKYVGDESTEIFSGKLKDYDNGSWGFLDFSEAQFAVIFEWNDDPTDDEVIYIIPQTEDKNNTIDIYNNKTTLNTEEGKAYNSSEPYKYGLFDIEATDKTGNKINSLKKAENIASITVVKNTDEELTGTIYLAIYDDKKLIDVKNVEISSMQEDKSYVKYNLNYDLKNITSKTNVKVMLWDGTTLFPYSLRLDMFYNYRIDVNTVLNQLYTFPITSKQSTNKFKVIFDENYFSIVDLCKETSIMDTQVGTVSDNIKIDEVTDNGFVFTFVGSNVNDCINRFVLKAKKTGNTYIEVEEITE